MRGKTRMQRQAGLLLPQKAQAWEGAEGRVAPGGPDDKVWHHRSLDLV